MKRPPSIAARGPFFVPRKVLENHSDGEPEGYPMSGFMVDITLSVHFRRLASLLWSDICTSTKGGC